LLEGIYEIGRILYPDVFDSYRVKLLREQAVFK